MQSCCFSFEQHRGRWAVFSAAFHHAERAPRVTSSLTAESPTIRSFPTILGVDTRILATRVRRARKTRKRPIQSRWSHEAIGPRFLAVTPPMLLPGRELVTNLFRKRPDVNTASQNRGSLQYKLQGVIF